MKFKWFVLFVILLSMVSSIAFTQQVSKEKPYTAEEETKIREGVVAVMKYIQTQQGLDSNTISQSKNIPDIVDKALDKFGTAISVIYANVQKAAPKVWMIMMQQQYAKAISSLAGPVFWLIVLIFTYRHLGKRWPASVDEIGGSSTSDKQFGYWFRVVITKGLPIFFIFIACCSLFLRLRDASLLFINPEYYAIRDLLVLLLGSSHGM